jgi:hypothetical protein
MFWIPAGALVSFLTSFLFGDLLRFPVDVYYLIYFCIVLGFLDIYKRRTGLKVKQWIKQRLCWAIPAGLLIGLLLVQNVLSRPETAKLYGWALVWGIFWRGIVYGTVDGLIIFAFPWVVTWRGLRGPERKIPGKIGVAFAAWLGILLITTVYHLGYRDFRSQKIVQPNIGSTICAVPTLVTANPLASLVSHVFLHAAAVIHSPETDLFLPPHREKHHPPGKLGEPQAGEYRPALPRARRFRWERKTGRLNVKYLTRTQQPFTNKGY